MFQRNQPLLHNGKNGKKNGKKHNGKKDKGAHQLTLTEVTNTITEVTNTITEKVTEIAKPVKDKFNKKTDSISRSTSKFFQPAVEVAEKINETARDTIKPVVDFIVFPAAMALKINNLKMKYKNEMDALYKTKAKTWFPFFIDFEIETKRQKREACKALFNAKSLEDLSSLSSLYMSDMRVSLSWNRSDMMDLLREIKTGCDQYLTSSNEPKLTR